MKATPRGDLSDATLVAQSVAGDRDAFGEIVARYQSLVCSLAYSAIGSVSASEDIAQETFFAAWRQLVELREPEKLRAWLCGIARNTIGTALRRRTREPSHAAESLEALQVSAAPEAAPSAQAVRREEEALVWRALQQMPETYREPLVLFYREQHSVASVAVMLELSEDVVRQRLSRGRTLLQAEVLALIEGTLGRTKPGNAFTQTVLGALPASAGAAAGAKAATGIGAAKAALAAGSAGAVIGLLGGLIGWWVPAQSSIALARSARERTFAVKVAWVTLALLVVFCALIFLYAKTAKEWQQEHPARYTIGLLTLIGGNFLALQALVWCWIVPTQRRIRREENAAPSSAEMALRRTRFFRPWAYRSTWKFLGLPLIDARGNRPEGDGIRPAIGWIAVGDVAIGGLFAAGGIAIAPISVGGAALGGLAVGGAALGGGAIGGLAIGFAAFGGGAFGWRWAVGGMARAHDYAFGGDALARHANDAAARAYLHGDAIERIIADFQMPVFVLQMLIAAGSIALVLWLRRKSRANQRPTD